MADKFTNDRAWSADTFGGNLTEWPVGASSLPKDVKAVAFNADGTADITNQDGTPVSAVPVLKMQPMLTVPLKVTAMSGATKCYLVS